MNRAFGGFPRAATLVAIAMAALVLAVPVRAQTSSGTEPTHHVAVVLRVPLFTELVDLEGRIVAEAEQLDTLARSLLRWTKPPLVDVPLSLAVGPDLCDALQIADRPDARRTLAALRRLARRADVLAVPYADVWLPYLADAAEVTEQLELGRDALRTCLGRNPSKTLFAHVLHTGEGEPTRDIDAEAVAAAHRLDLDHIVARGITQTPVRSDDTTVIPFVDVGSLAVNDDGTVREPTNVRRFALVTDAQAPEELGLVRHLTESGSVALTRVPDLGSGAPRVTVAFRDDPDVPRRYRDPVDRARDAVETFAGVTTGDNAIRTRLKISFARALSSASKDAEVGIELGEPRGGGEDLARQLERFVDRELDRITLSEGSVTFTSRRGAVPVTVANRTDYPVRVRVSVSSPKLTFPNGRTRVVTIEPPGDTITFEANARSTGTFPTLAVVKSRNGRVTLDRTELTVRSTATNLSALILTGGGAVFLLVFLVRRVGRRRVARDAKDVTG